MGGKEVLGLALGRFARERSGCEGRLGIQVLLGRLESLLLMELTGSEIGP